MLRTGGGDAKDNTGTQLSRCATIEGQDDSKSINDAVVDHTWIWRADHGEHTGWDANTSRNGIVVNGDRVSCYGLFVEHFQEHDVLWNGEDGTTYFLQNEKCYDPPGNARWMSHGGKKKGYAAYKVADGVKRHYAVGLACTTSSSTRKGTACISTATATARRTSLTTSTGAENRAKKFFSKICIYPLARRTEFLIYYALVRLKGFEHRSLKRGA